MSPTYMTFEDLKKALEESGRGYNMENITAAYNLANEAHADQKRRSGEPYISHPLNVDVYKRQTRPCPEGNISSAGITASGVSILSVCARGARWCPLPARKATWSPTA